MKVPVNKNLQQVRSSLSVQGKEGMVHISKLDKKRINRVEDVLTLGDVIKVKCLGKDKMGRISFSKKDAE